MGKQRKQVMMAARNGEEAKSKAKKEKERKLIRKGKGWRRLLEEFNSLSSSLKNPNGESRSFEENKMLILALRAGLNRRVRELNLDPEATINWTSIENEVARDFFVGNKLVHDLRTDFFEDGDVWVFGQDG